MNIRDIIPDRKITKRKNEEFMGLEYECWDVQIPLFGDKVEKLLENGFMVSILQSGKVNVCKQLNSSPEKLYENKQFWKQLMKELK